MQGWIRLTDSYNKKPVDIKVKGIMGVSQLKKTNVDEEYYITQVQVRDAFYRVSEEQDEVLRRMEEAGDE